MSSFREKLKALPSKPGVYLFKDNRGEILYVGKAKSLSKRVSSYFSKAPDLKTSILLARLHDIDYIVAASELDALLLEDELIKKYKPRYNISLRDDKAYPYLKLTVNEEWPRLFLARRREKDRSLYFGPFQGGVVRAMVRLIKELFPIRWCRESPLRLREQPCLYYRIGSCSGPCIGKTSREDYLALVKGIVMLLEGKMEKALQKLQGEMEKASEKQDFERAAYLRDRIKLLGKMMEGKDIKHVPSPRLPPGMRIEAFDVSNIQGTNMVGSMVVFCGEHPLKNEYRRFKIKSVKGKPDDVASIYEIVRRRYSGSLSRKLDRPHLILVDGGASQVHAAEKALKEAGIENIPVTGLAKKKEEVCQPQENVPRELLQRIRDEAHRFALAYHQLRRKKAFYR